MDATTNVRCVHNESQEEKESLKNLLLGKTLSR